MATPLDMSLDDLISKNKRSAAAARASSSSASRGSGGPAPSRRVANRPARRAAPYSASKVPGGYAAQMEGVVYQPAIETGAKLYVSNLDYGVSNEDIKELFSEVGELKRFSIHYDRSGRSKGTAEVVFARRPDALAAVKRYNNVQLDGKPMKIEIVGTNLSTPVPMVPNGRNGNLNGFPRSGPTRGPTRGGSTGGPRGGRAGGRGRGRGGQGRGRGEPPSATDLDADLEKYHKGAMQIN